MKPKALTYDFNLPRRLEEEAGNFGVLGTARYRFAIVFRGRHKVESRLRDVRQGLVLWKVKHVIELKLWSLNVTCNICLNC